MALRMNLFSKFLFVIIIISIVPLVIQGLKMMDINRSALEEVVMENHGHIAVSVAQDIDEFAGKLNLDLAFVLAFEQFPGMTRSAQYKILFSVINRNPEFGAVSLMDNTGREINKAVNTELAGEDTGYAFRGNTDVFISARKTQTPQFSKLYYQHNIPHIDVVYPLSNSGHYVYVKVTLQKIWKKIKNIDIGKRGFIDIVDTQGIRVYHGQDMHGYELKDVSDTELMRNTMMPVTSDNSMYTRFESDRGVSMVGAYSAASSFDWKVIVQQPRAEAFHSLILMRVQSVFLILLIGVVSIFTALMLGKSLAMPIKQLTIGAKKLGEGNFDYKVKVKSNDELKTLADTFNFMTQEIKQYQEELVNKERLAAVGQMASVVGHEIRNPLGVMNNAVYYIKSRLGDTDPKVLKHLGIIEKEIAASNKIVGDLLGFSRTRDPMAKPNDLNALLEETFGVISFPETVQLEKKLQIPLPQALMNTDEMRQVFINLFNNAVQAMEEKGGKLVVASSKDNGMARIEVRDTGSGIPPDVMKKLFTPFFTTKSKGTGLGLATVKRIIERHKGKIELLSEVGKGTTFVIHLPLAQ